MKKLKRKQPWYIDESIFKMNVAFFRECFQQFSWEKIKSVQRDIGCNLKSKLKRKYQVTICSNMFFFFFQTVLNMVVLINESFEKDFH